MFARGIEQVLPVRLTEMRPASCGHAMRSRLARVALIAGGNVHRGLRRAPITVFEVVLRSRPTSHDRCWRGAQRARRLLRGRASPCSTRESPSSRAQRRSRERPRAVGARVDGGGAGPLREIGELRASRTELLSVRPSPSATAAPNLIEREHAAVITVVRQAGSSSPRAAVDTGRERERSGTEQNATK